ITQEELNQINDGETPDLSSKTQIFKLNDNTFVEDVFNKLILNVGEGGCVISVVSYSGTSCTGKLHHAYGDPGCEAGDATPDMLIYTWGECPDGGGSGGGVDPGSSNGGGDNNDDVDTTPTIDPI